MVGRIRWRKTALLGIAAVLALGISTEQPAIDAASGIAPANDLETITFAVLGDSRGSEMVFPAILDSLHRIGPAFAVHLGDAIDGYTRDMSFIKKQWALVDRQLAGLRIPLLGCPGNHDVFPVRGRACPSLTREFSLRFGSTPRSISWGRAHLIMLNSSLPGSENRIGPGQLRWLRRELTLVGPAQGPVFIFMHHPLVSPTGRSLRDAEEVMDLLQGSAVHTVFCSHDHMFEQRTLPCGIPQIISGGAGASLRGLEPERGGFYHFLVVSVTAQEEVGITLHRIQDVQEPERPWPPPEYQGRS